MVIRFLSGDIADLPEDEAFVAIRTGVAVIEPDPQPDHETADGPHQRLETR